MWIGAGGLGDYGQDGDMGLVEMTTFQELHEAPSNDQGQGNHQAPPSGDLERRERCESWVGDFDGSGTKLCNLLITALVRIGA